MSFVMAKQRVKTNGGAKDPTDDAKLNTGIDPELRRQMDQYIADWNARNPHPATIRSTVEAAMKMFLRDAGYWGEKPTK